MHQDLKFYDQVVAKIPETKRNKTLQKPFKTDVRNRYEALCRGDLKVKYAYKDVSMLRKENR